MTREEALQHYSISCDNTWDFEKFINKIYDEFESTQNCNGCIHEPKKNGDTFPFGCGECSRWYGDRFERKETRCK